MNKIRKIFEIMINNKNDLINAENLEGDTSQLIGNAIGIHGYVTNRLHGRINKNIHGDVTGLSGNISGISSGDVTELMGYIGDIQGAV